MSWRLGSEPALVAARPGWGQRQVAVRACWSRLAAAPGASAPRAAGLGLYRRTYPVPDTRGGGLEGSLSRHRVHVHVHPGPLPPARLLFSASLPNANPATSAVLTAQRVPLGAAEENHLCEGRG